MSLLKNRFGSEFPLRSIELSTATYASEQKAVRRVGRVLPFPITENGEKRWYYVDGLLNDGGGDVNYVLIPACKGYMAHAGDLPKTGKRAPLIKLYRSTASDGEQESSIDSILADTNPNKVGDTDFGKGDEYETAYFNRCTMPVWAAYLTINEIDKATEAFKIQPPIKEGRLPDPKISRRDMLEKFLAWQIQTKGGNDALNVAQTRLNSLIGKIGLPAFNDYLSKPAGMEWDKEKMAQDIHFVGHSLGGGLGQSGFYHFGAEAHRIPLFGCQFKCFAFDTSGVTTKEAEGLIDFGRLHTALIQNLGQKWEIHYQFEQGDVVPQGGDCFLGVQKYDKAKDENWLLVTGTIQAPIAATDTDPPITTAPTHGRRFQTENGQRFTYDLTIAEMDQIKRNWSLNNTLRDKFGYRWTLPYVSEKLRGALGACNSIS